MIDDGSRVSARPTSKRRRRLSSDEDEERGQETAPPDRLTDDGTSKAAAADEAPVGPSSIDGLRELVIDSAVSGCPEDAVIGCPMPMHF